MEMVLVLDNIRSTYNVGAILRTAEGFGVSRVILSGYTPRVNDASLLPHLREKLNHEIHKTALGAEEMLEIYSSHDIFTDLSEYKKGGYRIVGLENNIDDSNDEKLLSSIVEDYMYMSSQTYYNWFNENSNLDNLPTVRNNNKWNQFESINVPILTFSGSNEEDYYLQLDLLKDKAINCNDFESQIIENAGHTYNGKEEETAKLIFEWINKKF